ncbi:phosphodiester glycosidase family protein [Acaryochloris marina]|nr:phosphodiester glycosidase family protein [Acaryochloris marina]
MRLIRWSISMSLVMGLGFCTAPSQLSPQPQQPPPTMQYQKQELSQATVHVLRIPNHPRYTVRLDVVDGLQTVADFAQGTPKPVAVINGGYFDPANQLTTSYIRRGGQILADPTQNSRLVDNPDLKVYLPKILNRSEFRQYQCGAKTTYAITSYNQPIPPDCTLNYALGAGPQLLPQLTSQAEGFTDSVDGQVIRDAIGSRQPNARSAVGITDKGEVIWVLVEQQSATKPGLSLPELADFMEQQGAASALNLDGGSSSSLVYQDQVITGRSLQGEPLLRPVKSVLMVLENAPK